MLRFLSVILGTVLASTAAAQDPLGSRPGAQTPEVARPSGKEVARPKRKKGDAEKSGQNSVNHQNSLGLPLVKNILSDQKKIWTSPLRWRLEDANWLVPLGGLTAGLLATDRDNSGRLSSSPQTLKKYRNLSTGGVAAFVGSGSGLYLWGKFTRDDHKRETGVLSGEAVLNSLIMTSGIKLAAGRERPLADKGTAKFWSGGSSFPSEHAAAAWSVASIIAQEYPGPLTKLLTYSAASAVSIAQIRSKRHFASDVLIGGAIGWFVGRQVYRAHHDPELGGETEKSDTDSLGAETHRRPGNAGTAYVPLENWIYPAFERLAALGYVRTAFLGLRPWARLECARLLDEAEDRFRAEGSPTGEAYELYLELRKEFTGDFEVLGGVRNRSVRLESIYARLLGIGGTPLRDGYHFGQTILNDYGRPFAEGANSIAGFSARAAEGPWAVYVRAEYQHSPSGPALPDQVRQLISKVDSVGVVPPPTPFASIDRVRLLDAYVAFNFSNWQLSFGKQSLWWGSGPSGPLMFNDNADPINMLRVSRVTPFELPSIFRWLGPMRVEFFMGRLEGHKFVIGPTGLLGQWGRPLGDQPFIHGQKISFKPTPNLEFSVSRTNLIGGTGQPLTWHTFLNSMVSTNNGPPGSRSDPGDRRSGVDVSYRIPGLRNWLILYGESFAEDEISPLRFPHRSAMNPGIYLPRIPKLPKLDFRAEGAYTDLPDGLEFSGFYYFNVRFLNGYTNNGNLLGHWVGREGHGVQAWSTYWLSPRSTITVSYRHAKVSAFFVPGGGTVNDIGGRTELWLRPTFSMLTSLQYEKWAFPILAPGKPSNVTASVLLTYWPRKKIK